MQKKVPICHFNCSLKKGVAQIEKEIQSQVSTEHEKRGNFYSV